MVAAAARDGEAGPLPELEAVGAPRPLPLKPPSRRGRCAVVLCLLPLLPPSSRQAWSREGGERREGRGSREPKEARQGSKEELQDWGRLVSKKGSSFL